METSLVTAPLLHAPLVCSAAIGSNQPDVGRRAGVVICIFFFSLHGISPVGLPAAPMCCVAADLRRCKFHQVAAATSPLCAAGSGVWFQWRRGALNGAQTADKTVRIYRHFTVLYGTSAGLAAISAHPKMARMCPSLPGETCSPCRSGSPRSATTACITPQTVMLLFRRKQKGKVCFSRNRRCCLDAVFFSAGKFQLEAASQAHMRELRMNLVSARSQLVKSVRIYSPREGNSSHSKPEYKSACL